MGIKLGLVHCFGLRLEWVPASQHVSISVLISTLSDLNRNRQAVMICQLGRTAPQNPEMIPL